MDKSTLSILLVDDDIYLQESLADALSFDGYSVLSASDGREALDILASDKKINLVISDLQMPVMDGAELRLAMQAQGFTCPFILSTGNPDSLSEELLSKLNIDAFIAKPYSLEKLEQHIDDLFLKYSASKKDG